MKIRSLLTYICTVITPIGLGMLLSYVITGNAGTYQIMFSLGFTLLFALIIVSIAKKQNIALNIYATDFADSKQKLLNDILVALLFTVPLCIFSSLLF